MTSKVLLGVTVLASLVVGQVQDRKSSVNGFMDVSAEKYFLDDHSLHRPNLNNYLDVRLDHLNLYFDFQPNSSLRTLAEVRLLNLPSYYGHHYAWYMNTYLQSVLFRSDTMSEDAQTTDLSISDPSNGADYRRSWVSLERAWFEYLLDSKINVRIGKFITPVGIWNVDHGSPVIATVLQPYQASITPIFPMSQLGVMARGIAFIGDYDLDYAAYLSTGRNGYRIAEPREVAVGVNAGVKIPYLDGIDFGISGFTGQYVERSYSRTTEITMASPMDFGAFSQFYDPEKTTVDETKLADARELCLGADLLVPFGGAKYQSEINYQKLRNDKLTGVSDADRLTEVLGMYHLLAYKVRLSKDVSVEPYGMIEWIGCSNAPANPQAWFTNDPQTGEQLLKDFTTYIAGVNFGLFTYSHIKVEYSFVDARTINGYKDYQYAWDMQSVRTQFSLAF